MNEYLASQLAGVEAQAQINTIQNSFINSENVSDYLYNLNIDNAKERELDSIGLLIGFPRPTIPNIFSPRLFLFGDTEAPLRPFPRYFPIAFGTSDSALNSLHGFGSVNSMDGGYLSTVYATSTELLPIETYRFVLKAIAVIKCEGVTIKSIDTLMKQIREGYLLSYNSRQDIVVTFSPSISTENVWILNKVFELFCTAPQITITN